MQKIYLSEKEKQRQQEGKKKSAFFFFRGTHMSEENILKEEICMALIFQI